MHSTTQSTPHRSLYTPTPTRAENFGWSCALAAPLKARWHTIKHMRALKPINWQLFVVVFSHNNCRQIYSIRFYLPLIRLKNCFSSTFLPLFIVSIFIFIEKEKN